MKDTPSIRSEQSEPLLHSTQIVPENAIRKLRRNQILVLAGGVCIQLVTSALIHLMFKVLGTFNLWGAISLYVASYLRSFDSSVNIDMFSIVFPFLSFGMVSGIYIGLPLAEKFGYRLTLTTGMVFIAISVFCSSFITNFYLFVVVSGVLVGVSSGVLYFLPVVCGWKLFPNRKGLVSGVTMGAFGFGSFVFNFVALAIVNPNDEDPDQEYENNKYFDSNVYNRVPFMFRMLSLCYLALGMLGVILIRVPKVYKRLGSDIEDTRSHETSIIQIDNSGCQSVKDGLLSLPFFNLFIIGCFGTFFGLFIVNNFKVYGITQIPDDAFVTLVGSLGSVCNGCSRVGWALLFDKFGFKKVYFAIITLQTILAPTLYLIATSKALYLIWICLIMTCEGGHFSLLPSVAAGTFGMKYGPKIYRYIAMSFTIAQIAGFLVSNYALNVFNFINFYNVTKTLGWTAVFYMAFGFSIIAFISNVIFREKFARKK